MEPTLKGTPELSAYICIEALVTPAAPASETTTLPAANENTARDDGTAPACGMTRMLPDAIASPESTSLVDAPGGIAYENELAVRPPAVTFTGAPAALADPGL